jgi:hypothetical protein
MTFLVTLCLESLSLKCQSPTGENRAADFMRCSRGEHTKLSKDAFLTACQRLRTEPDRARVEWVAEEDEDEKMDLRGVVRVTRKRTYEN